MLAAVLEHRDAMIFALVARVCVMPAKRESCWLAAEINVSGLDFGSQGHGLDALTSSGQVIWAQWRIMNGRHNVTGAAVFVPRILDHD